MAETPDYDEIVETFELIDDWEERYRYLIELGKALPGLPEAQRSPATKVDGCASQVWLVTEPREGRLFFEGDSDAFIVRGLIALLKARLSGRPIAEVAASEPLQDFAALGLDQALSPQRSNGLAAMARRIKADAEAAEPS